MHAHGRIVCDADFGRVALRLGRALENRPVKKVAL
jgi:hypothetical protein